MSTARRKKPKATPKPKWPVPSKVWGMEGWAAKLRDVRGFMPLSEQAMHTVGSAAQTLGALYLVVNSETRQTFYSVPKLVPYACLPARTIRGHLNVLQEGGWIVNHGRLPPGPNRKARRSCTIELTRDAMAAKRPYYPMPLWLNGDAVTWSERAVYAVILSRWCLVENIEETEGCADDRRGLSAADIAKATGLSIRAVKGALHLLRYRFWLVKSDPHNEDGNARGLILTDDTFRRVFPKHADHQQG